MPRMYTVTIAATASPAAQFDALELNPAANKPCRIARMVIGQVGEPTSEEENIMVSIVRGHTTSGSGGTAPTPAPVSSNSAAAGFTVEVMNTTIASAGTGVVTFAKPVNFRSGDDIPFAPEESIWAVTERTVVRVGAPADAMNIVATFFIEEQP